MRKQPETEWITVDEAAALIGICPRNVRAAAAKGWLEKRQLSARMILISRDSAMAYRLAKATAKRRNTRLDKVLEESEKSKKIRA